MSAFDADTLLVMWSASVIPLVVRTVALVACAARRVMTPVTSCSAAVVAPTARLTVTLCLPVALTVTVTSASAPLDRLCVVAAAWRR